MFTKNLREQRIKTGLTQKQVAEELGTKQQNYMRWETGKNSPTLITLEKLAKFFNITVSELVSEKTEESEN
ncbi:helix-turn-helix domain-containing protein [Streptococcus ovis]|uniref:helix-turn-helix domain-containing protein n=1 Tax=Streptococcus ovis TaxID=82806 RepID=UPI000361A41E|nr:helix-turn-helix transcriptional regulator [Streptococcus ovis]